MHQIFQLASKYNLDVDRMKKDSSAYWILYDVQKLSQLNKECKSDLEKKLNANDYLSQRVQAFFSNERKNIYFMEWEFEKLNPIIFKEIWDEEEKPPKLKSIEDSLELSEVLEKYMKILDKSS